MTATSVPIDEVSRELARIAARPGWRVTRSSREPGGVEATIEKDGVVLGLVIHHADGDETVRLRTPVHPPVALYPYREPPIGDLLDAIGAPRDTEDRFTAIADRLPAVKRHLIDPAVFRRHVLVEAEQTHATYVSLGANPAFADLRASMLSRHPWLDRGVPPVETLLIAPRDVGGAGVTHGYRIAVVLLAVAVGIAVARIL